MVVEYASTVSQGRTPTMGRFIMTVRRLSSDKCNYCKSLWISVCKTPECKCNMLLVLVSSPLLDLSLILSHIMYAMFLPVRWLPVENHSMSFHASTDTRPRNMIGRITFEGKENETPSSPRYELVHCQT